MSTGKIDKDLRNQTQIIKSYNTNWIAIILLWIGICLCGYFGIITNAKVIVAFLLLAIASATSYYNYKLGTIITLGIIIIGAFDLVDFFPFKQYFGIDQLK